MPKLCLVGMMGSGKSTVGLLVANRLGWPFADSDRIVEAESGRSIAEIFAGGREPRGGRAGERGRGGGLGGSGEQAFRELEEAVVARLLGTPGPMVVALGGGAPTIAATRERLTAATVAWLRGSPRVLAGRLRGATDRPLLAGGPAPEHASQVAPRGESAPEIPEIEETLRRIEECRRPTYEAVADLVVDTEGRSPQEVAESVTAAVLGALPRAPR
ncbi:MAG: shikimate kinase [Acidimicrobiales bacterium]